MNMIERDDRRGAVAHRRTRAWHAHVARCLAISGKVKDEPG